MIIFSLQSVGEFFLDIRTLKRKLQPNLCLTGFTFSIIQLCNKGCFITPLPPCFFQQQAKGKGLEEVEVFHILEGVNATHLCDSIESSIGSYYLSKLIPSHYCQVD